MTGTTSQVTAAVDALIFTPTARQVQVGRSVSTGFMLAVTDTAGHSSSTATSVVATHKDLPPVITGAVANQVVADTATLRPLATVAVTDPDGGLQETATFTLSNTANGVLSNLGNGSYDAAHGVYSVTGSAQSITAALEQLVFTPVAHEAAAGSTVATGFTPTVQDTAGGTAINNTTSVLATQSATAAAAKTATVPALSSASAVPLSQGQAYSGGDAAATIVGNTNGGDSVTLGNGNNNVNLNGYGNTAKLGNGNNTVATGSGNATIVVGNGNNTITGSGYTNVVSVGAGSDTIDVGYGARITATGGQQAITLHGYNNAVFLGGAVQASVTGGDGSSQFVTTGGSANILLGGYGNTVTTGAASDTITDGLGSTVFNVGGTNAGVEILRQFAANAGSVVDVATASAGGRGSADLFASLQSTSGGAVLNLSGGGSVLFVGETPNQLHASNFRVG